jgi:hypothetical protein
MLALMLAIFSAYTLAQVPLTLAQPTVVKVTPSAIEFGPEPSVGEEFTINVTVQDVVNLYGLDIQFSWNTTYLEYVSHTVKIPVNTNPDGVLYNPILPIKDEADAAAGTYWIAISSMAPAAAFNGTGTAFTMTLRIIAQPDPGEEDIETHLTFTSTDLADKDAQPIAHNVEEGTVTIHAPPKAPPAVIRVEPQEMEFTSDVIGNEFDVETRLYNVTNLYGFDVQLAWNTTYLEYVSHTVKIPVDTYPDGVLYNPIVQIKDEVDSAAGTYWLVYSSMAPAPTFNGTGTAFTMTLRIIAQPISPPEEDVEVDVYIRLASVDLADINANPIEYESFDSHIIIHGIPQPEGPTIRIAPETYSFKGTVPHTLNVNISIQDLHAYWDLSGLDLQLSYNPDQMQVTNVLPGPFLEQFNITYSIKQEIDNEQGSIWLVYLQLMPPEERLTPYGTGTLFTITANAKGSGPLTIYSSDLAAFPHPERSESPWNNSETSVPIPHEVASGFIEIAEIKSHQITVGQQTFTVTTESNSTISTVIFRPEFRAIQFSMEGVEGSTGYCNISIPKSLMWSTIEDGWFVLVNGELIEPHVTADQFNTYLYFTVKFSSTEQITIMSTSAVPELISLPMILALLTTVTTIVTLAKRWNKPPKKK